MKESETIDENIDDFLKKVSNLSSVNMQVCEEIQAILLMKSLPNQYKYLNETLKRNLISSGTLDVVGFKHSGGEGNTRFYNNGKLALQDTLSGSLYFLDGKTVSGQVNNSVQKKTMSLSKDESWSTFFFQKRTGSFTIEKRD